MLVYVSFSCMSHLSFLTDSHIQNAISFDFCNLEGKGSSQNQGINWSLTLQRLNGLYQVQ